MPGILKISDAASLGLHAMAFLAKQGGTRCSNKEIAGKLAVSEAHLAKVMQRLEHAGMVRGTRGPAGGFELLKSAASLSLKMIYEVIEGPIDTTHCLLGEPACNGRCPLGGLVADLDRQVKERLAGISLADFASKSGIQAGTTDRNRKAETTHAIRKKRETKN